EQDFSYALAVPSIEVVCVQTLTGCLLTDVGSIAHHLRARNWQRLSQSQGTKGERLFDWAILPWMQAGTGDGHHLPFHPSLPRRSRRVRLLPGLCSPNHLPA